MISSGYRIFVLTIFFVGLLFGGLVGTSSSMTFIWPAFFLIGLAGALSIGALFQQLRFTAPPGPTVAILALSGYLLIRASDSPVAYFAREDVALIVSALLVYAATLLLCSTVPARRALLLTLAAVVVVNIVYAILQATVDPRLWLIPGYERTEPSGVGGLFNRPDHFAGFLAALVPLWLAMFCFGRARERSRMHWMLLAAASTAAVALSGSVAGLLVLGGGVVAFLSLLVFVVWKRLKPGVRRIGRIALFVIAIGGASGLVLAAEPLAARLGGASPAVPDGSNLAAFWQAGIDQAKESPWIGTGSRSSYIYGRLFRSAELGPEAGEPEFVHNEYLQLLADYGLVGLGLGFLALFFHLRHGLRFLSAFQPLPGSEGGLLPRSFHLALTVGAFSSLAAIGVSACFDFTLHLPAFVLLAAACLALLAAPDPMARVFPRTRENRYLPGGGLLFSLRAIGFGCGLALALFGAIFARSEFHYERARVAFEADRTGFRQFRHLQEARRLDPRNPYAFSLSAHAQVAGITPEMAPPARAQALETANRYFETAHRLYPQDIFSAIGHAAVLEELGRSEDARDRLAEAREWAPRYGNLMLAEAELHLRRGEVGLAERSYRESLEATAFADPEAAEQGMRTISEWKLIAQQEGIRWDEPGLGYPDETPAGGLETKPPEARITERSLAGRSNSPDTPNAEPNVENPAKTPIRESEPPSKHRVHSDPSPIEEIPEPPSEP